MKRIINKKSTVINSMTEETQYKYPRKFNLLVKNIYFKCRIANYNIINTLKNYTK